MRLYKVAVVDDHPIICTAVRVLLEGEGDFEFAGQAGSVPEAKRLLLENEPDVVVLDLWLGGNDGIELIKCLRSLVPQTALLCYTMNDACLCGERAIRAGAAGFLSKKGRQEELLVALHTICRGNRYMDKRLADSLLNGLLLRGSIEQHDCLSDRELQVLRLLGLALSNTDIADQLGVGIKTVNSHRENIKKKLGLHNSGELIRHAVLLVERGFFG